MLIHLLGIGKIFRIRIKLNRENKLLLIEKYII
jgi:hypothetical protein